MSPGEAKSTDHSGDSTSDLALARRAADGDSAAFRTLVDRHSAGLFRMSCSMTATRSDAEDLLQETFVGAYGGLKKFNGASSVKTWLTSILMRQAAKAWHRNRHHRKTRSIEVGENQDNSPSNSKLLGSAASATPTGSSSDASGPTAERLVDLKHDLELLLQRLDPAHREILVLREMQQLTYDEIAQLLSVPRGTVESRLFRARAELRRHLKAYRPEQIEES
jgi:RNA polymerase sigma-70 factor (ECF subfamily)